LTYYTPWYDSLHRLQKPEKTRVNVGAVGDDGGHTGESGEQ
jgi:hypothetical protein